MLSVSAVSAADAESARPVVQPPERFVDFGHMGVEYVVYHTFKLVNSTDRPYRILKVTPHCQCLNVSTADSVLEPGDTAYFWMSFNSENFYGATQKSFTVYTDHPENSEIQYSFFAMVGQWTDGIKPEPKSVFFLPNHKPKKVIIENTQFDEISVAILRQYNESFTVNVVKERAGKGQALELEIAPRADLSSGTYNSCVTLAVSRTGQNGPIILTIPVKIVRY